MNQHILVVDDDASVRGMLGTALKSFGFAVTLSSNGPDAIRAYEGQRDAIDLVLLDVQMPGLDGPQTLAALRKANPEVRCCFMSGYAATYSEAELLGMGASQVIGKPFGNLDALATRLRDAADRVP